MPRLTIALVLAALVVPGSAAAATAPATGWDVRLQSKLTYAYDQGDPEVVRKGSGTASLDVKQIAIFLPQRAGATGSLFGGELRGRQTPGALSYTFGDESCTGFLTAGGGERAIGDRPFREPKPKETSRKLEVTAEGLSVPFTGTAAYVRCTSEGVGVPMLRGRLAPHVLPLPSPSKRTVTLRSTVWRAYAPCGDDEHAGTGTPPATIETPDGPCALQSVVTEDLTLTFTRRCRRAKVRTSHGVTITDCRKGT